MSPRNKSHTPRSSRPTITTTSTTMKQTSQHQQEQTMPRTPRKSPTPSSIPTLPDVHKATPSSGGFLHTLLLEDGRGGGGSDDVSRSSSGGSRGSRGSKGKGGRQSQGQGQGRRVYTPPAHDGSAKPSSPLDTLTARSDKLLTATWPRPGADPASSADPRPKAHSPRQRRHSRDGQPSTRRLSGPHHPSRKRFKHRVSPANDASKQQSTRRYSSPAAPSPISESSTQAAEVGGENEVSAPVTSQREESLHDMLETGSRSSGEGQGEERLCKEESGTATSHDAGRSGEESTSNTADTQQDYNISTTMVTPLSDSADNHVTSLTSTSPRVTTTTTTTMTPRGQSECSPTTSEPFNQWTVCRALDDTDDENNDDEDDDNDNDNDEGISRVSDVSDLHHDDGSVADGRASRLTSSGPGGRRKRPLLLPPIMLPPIYSVQPTPLVVRDDLYFAKLGARAHRPLTDAEWDKLQDCRYLRIRTYRRPVKA